MGINLALILGHRLSPSDLVKLPERASTSHLMQQSAKQLWDVMKPRWANLGPLEDFMSFKAEEHLTENEIVVSWTYREEIPSFDWAGFKVHFGKHAVLAIHIEKLVGFVLDLNSLRTPLWTCARALATELHSPKILFGPDSFSPFESVINVEDGSSLDDILGSAKSISGPPVVRIRDMADEEEELNLSRNCYYVESISPEI